MCSRAHTYAHLGLSRKAWSNHHLNGSRGQRLLRLRRLDSSEKALFCTWHGQQTIVMASGQGRAMTGPTYSFLSVPGTVGLQFRASKHGGDRSLRQGDHSPLPPNQTLTISVSRSLRLIFILFDLLLIFWQGIFWGLLSHFTLAFTPINPHKPGLSFLCLCPSTLLFLHVLTHSLHFCTLNMYSWNAKKNTFWKLNFNSNNVIHSYLHSHSVKILYKSKLNACILMGWLKQRQVTR